MTATKPAADGFVSFYRASLARDERLIGVIRAKADGTYVYDTTRKADKLLSVALPSADLAEVARTHFPSGGILRRVKGISGTTYRVFCTPRYAHDCDCCVFAGRLDSCDIWVCPKGNPPGKVAMHKCEIILRRSDDGPDYSSADYMLATSFPERFGKAWQMGEQALNTLRG